MNMFPNQESPKAGPLRIIMVDYEPSVLNALQYLIQDAFKHVTAKLFLNSGEAWQELAQADPDVLIMEYRMPGLSGQEMLQRLMERKAACRIVVIATLEAFEQPVREFASRGLNVAFLPKPFGAEGFREAMGQFGCGIKRTEFGF